LHSRSRSNGSTSQAVVSSPHDSILIWNPTSGPRRGRSRLADAAIAGLAIASPRAGELIRLRFFAGLTEVGAANALGISERTARREWTFARAWLFDALNE